MAISYKLKQLTKETYDIVRCENGMAAAIVITDTRHEDDSEMIFLVTGDNVSLMYIAAKAMKEVIAQSRIKKKKLFRIISKAIDLVGGEEVANE
jgi:hypothetical protein